MTTRSLSACLLIVSVSLLAPGCETPHGGSRPKTLIGGAGGAAAGGLLGAALGGGAKGMAAGTVLGGLIGGAIGERLDAADRTYAAQSTHQALEYAPVRRPVTWCNPDSGNDGRVVTTRTYQAPPEPYCREYQHTVVIGGKEDTADGTACRRPDGTWERQH